MGEAPRRVQLSRNDQDIAFLREAARYFAKRPTHGEDCDRIADRLANKDTDHG